MTADRARALAAAIRGEYSIEGQCAKDSLLMAVLELLEGTAPPASSQGLIHGTNCNKATHREGGYLHAETDDSPYDVDGVTYCGRCHGYLP